ncbi:hypothetical protein OQA88_7956 [Cercophora sp. LCS_1]
MKLLAIVTMLLPLSLAHPNPPTNDVSPASLAPDAIALKACGLSSKAKKETNIGCDTNPTHGQRVRAVISRDVVNLGCFGSGKWVDWTWKDGSGKASSNRWVYVSQDGWNCWIWSLFVEDGCDAMQETAGKTNVDPKLPSQPLTEPNCSGESSYATSLAPSVLNYPVEHGRRYHAFRAGRYSRPNDEQEMTRLLLLHEIMTRLQGGLYLAPVDASKAKRILDIGTGTGIWATSIAETFPNATITGNDLSPPTPTFIPPNVRFEVDDVESPWVHAHKFDYIFSRYMAASIHDWPKLVSTVFENLSPGGFAEFQDFDLQYYSEDGSLKPDSALLVWISTLLDAARKLGREPNPGSKLEAWVKEAGFDEVVHRRFKVPIGPWARDPLLKEVGTWNYMQVEGGVEGLSMRLFTSVLGWEEGEIRALLERVKRDLRDGGVHALFDL